MTIAMCYMSPEGVVLGADSTSSLTTPQRNFHHFDHNQKLFELGEGGYLGILTWGLGGLGEISHRTLFNRLADDLAAAPPSSALDAATRWTDQFWVEYLNYLGQPGAAQLIARCKELDAKPPYNPYTSVPVTGARTQQEQGEFLALMNLFYVGFCIAGCVGQPRAPGGAVVTFDCLHNKPTPAPLPMNSYGFWGAPNMIKRLIWGYDEELERSMLASGKWVGTPHELRLLLDSRKLEHAVLPIRDAVDFVHSCIYSTIKGMKFSHSAQICGGPIEIAVITTDRPFRWVKHKGWDAAILEGERLW